jgi:hypothetical protein
MNNETWQAHMEASDRYQAELKAKGIVQFDGDPHWDAAMRELAAEAVKNGLAQRQQREKQPAS